MAPFSTFKVSQKITISKSVPICSALVKKENRKQPQDVLGKFYPEREASIFATIPQSCNVFWRYCNHFSAAFSLELKFQYSLYQEILVCYSVLFSLWTELTKHSKYILLLNMNLEGFSYNLQQTESKLAHWSRRYSLPKECNVITLALWVYDITWRHRPGLVKIWLVTLYNFFWL